MTLSTTTNRISYAGNGVTTAFSFPYYFLANADLVVIKRVDATGVETTQVITTNYTVAGAGVQAGGTVTMLVAPASGETLVIYRDPAKTQDLDLVENDPLPAEELEERLDKAMMVAQRLSDRLDRAIVLKATDTAATLELPLKADRASMFLAFDADGDPTASASASSGFPVSAFMETLLDDADGSEALTTLGVSTYAKTLLDDTSAGAAQTTLGISTFIKTLLDDADAGTAQTTLGISTFVKTILDDADAATVRTTIGFAGTGGTVQIANLDATLALAVSPRSEVSVSSGNGHGAVNTRIRRFTTTDKNSGTAITYADSANNGGSFTINEAGLYTISYCDASSGTAVIGVSVNGSALTTSIESQTYAQGKRIASFGTTAGNPFCSWTGVLAVNDVVRAHTNASPDSTTTTCMFTITKVSA